MPSLNPYLSFKSDARSAMEYYQSVFGGDLDISTFGSFEGMAEDPSENDLVMHAQLTTPDGFILMAPTLPDTLTRFVEHIVPRLTDHGIYPGEYAGDTLRENLGLARPAGRYAA